MSCVKSPWRQATREPRLRPHRGSLTCGISRLAFAGPSQQTAIPFTAGSCRPSPGGRERVRAAIRLSDFPASSKLGSSERAGGNFWGAPLIVRGSLIVRRSQHVSLLGAVSASRDGAGAYSLNSVRPTRLGAPGLFVPDTRATARDRPRTSQFDGNSALPPGSRLRGKGPPSGLASRPLPLRRFAARGRGGSRQPVEGSLATWPLGSPRPEAGRPLGRLSSRICDGTFGAQRSARDGHARVEDRRDINQEL